jgi:hypothetical protein
MAENKKRLHGLDKIDRHSLTYGSLIGTALVAAFAFVFFLFTFWGKHVKWQVQSFLLRLLQGSSLPEFPGESLFALMMVTR